MVGALFSLLGLHSHFALVFENVADNNQIAETATSAKVKCINKQPECYPWKYNFL